MLAASLRQNTSLLRVSDTTAPLSTSNHRVSATFNTKEPPANTVTMMRLLLVTILCASAFAFAPQSSNKRATATSLFARKPTFNKKTETWEKASDDDGLYPYDAVGSLLRHGPSPFITRLTNADEYEQAVLKYMANAGVSRAEATGNMDAKLNNAMDWTYQKMAEKNGAPKVDYTTLKKKNAILVAVWAFGITPLALSVIQQTVSQF